jgi:hypothetical protein
MKCNYCEENITGEVYKNRVFCKNEDEVVSVKEKEFCNINCWSKYFISCRGLVPKLSPDDWIKRAMVGRMMKYQR